MQEKLSVSNQELQQIIANAVHSALSSSGIESKTETVSTDSSLDNLTAMSKRICERRMKTISKKIYASNK